MQTRFHLPMHHTDASITVLPHNNFSPALKSPDPLEDVLQVIKSKYSCLGDFLVELFQKLKCGKKGRTHLHSMMVSRFLGGRDEATAVDIVKLMYMTHEPGLK